MYLTLGPGVSQMPQIQLKNDYLIYKMLSHNKHSRMRAIVTSGSRLAVIQAGNVTVGIKSKQYGRKTVCLVDCLLGFQLGLFKYMLKTILILEINYVRHNEAPVETFRSKF